MKSIRAAAHKYISPLDRSLTISDFDLRIDNSLYNRSEITHAASERYRY